jgi:hypothetical protein
MLNWRREVAAPRSAYCIFCDDLRQEVGNKHSYMGVYGDDMVFPENPPDGTIVIPKIVIVATLVTDVDDLPSRVGFLIYGPPGRTEIARFYIPDEQLPNATIVENARIFRLTANFPIFGLALQSSSILEASVETETGTLIAGRLKLVIPGRRDTGEAYAVTSPPTASSEPQSEKSPPADPQSKRSLRRRRPSGRRTSQTPDRG